MSESELRRTRRHLPHWELQGSTYFITFRLKTGVMPHDEKNMVYNHIRRGEPRFYRLFALVVMPDHVHMLARPAEGIALSSMMKGTKGVTARLINASRRTTGPVWLGESYDRIIRDEEEAIEKQNYTVQNPERAGIVQQWQDYPFVYRGKLW